MRRNSNQASSGSVPVESLKHKDKRTNIPTEELRGFMDDEEKNPKTLLYPRDPSLDPQLVWTGKDEQDREDLVVPAVPVYIQEKIHPRALIEQVRAEAQKGAPAQLDCSATSMVSSLRSWWISITTSRTGLTG